ncbi:MAG: putative Ig domain-containing protein [Blastocatellia bacterium]|nr:putative Ig domain-containing protein [Blastocatellia bacterium]
MLRIPAAMQQRPAAGGNIGVFLQAGTIDVSGEPAGMIALTVPFGFVGGEVRANGEIGGRISIEGGYVVTQGQMEVNGGWGNGGTISIQTKRRVVQTQSSELAANGGPEGAGGVVLVHGDNGIFTSGRLSASGGERNGGRIEVTGATLDLVAATLEANGATAGGTVLVGGDFHGANAAVPNAKRTNVSEHTVLRADATRHGTGGNVVVWSDQSTTAAGLVSVAGGRYAGNGGRVELSSKNTLQTGGRVEADAPAGTPGSVLLDPKNLILDDATGQFPFFNYVDPNVGNGNGFGFNRLILSTGNLAISKPGDNAGGASAGAAYLFNRQTGALISTLLGNTANSQVSAQGLIDLRNGNYVVDSRDWDNGATTDVGAVTWVNGTTGLNGIVSSSNSLVGTIASDQIGAGLTVLTNGNYVASGSNWDNGAAVNAGAATWGNGTTGITGAVSAANSIVGTATIHNVAVGGVVALTNGNFVVLSRLWDNGATANVGAVTWGNGTNGQSATGFGAVSASNSMIGSTADDQIGNFAFALTNGNYVIQSRQWNNGAIVDAGAATWCNGTTGQSVTGFGTLSAANSLVGSTTTDNVSNNIASLSNGNYVVNSPNWDNGATANVGAVTWGNGTTGTIGAVSTSNSLVGSTASDQIGVGGTLALNNGNYVVFSRLWNNGAATAAGAVTWCDGTTGRVGTVSAANSLVGATTNDNVGMSGQPLTNGNFVATCPNCDIGGVVDAGAATWGNGTSGLAGTVSAANSLVGSSTSDMVGQGVFFLTNGNYVVASPSWSNGATTDVGAATWGNGTVGVTGTVTPANSLIGTRVSDQVGFSGVRALMNGNYLVNSNFYDNGAIPNTGAVTFGNGVTGLTGQISSANSFFGAVTNDLLNIGSVALADGNFVVQSGNWSNGALANAGIFAWGNGTTGKLIDGGSTLTQANGVTGTIMNSNANSLILDDTAANGSFIGGFLNELGSGRVFTGFPSVNQLTYSRGQSQTVTIRSTLVNATLNAGTNVVLQASNDITVNSPLTSSGASGNLTLQAGRSVILNAPVNVTGNFTVIANDTLANGVVNVFRDAGAAVVTALQPIRSQNGNVTIDLRNGAGKTNFSSGNIVLNSVQGNSIAITNNGPTAGSAIRVTGTIASGGCTGASLCTAEDGGGAVTITHPNSASAFVVGDSTLNGTAGTIVTGAATVGTPTTIVNQPGTFTKGNISVTPGQLQCPTISVTNPGTTTGTAGTAFNQTFANSAGTPVVTFAVASGTVPPGLTLGTDGVLSGTPTQPGTFPFTVRATDSNGCQGTGNTYTLVIACQTISVSPATIPSAIVGTGYAQTFTQTNGNGAITFSTTGNVPPGLTMATNGTLSGTPTTAGTFNFTVTATDGNTCTGTQNVSLLVLARPTIAPGGPLNRQQGSTGTNVTIATVSDVETAAGNLVVTTTNVPAGLTVSGITNTNGTVTATVAADCTATVGTNQVALQVTDGDNLTATANLTVNVAANSAPVLTYSTALVASNGGRNILPATGLTDNGTLVNVTVQSQGTYSGSISVNSTNGVITLGNAAPLGTHTIVIRATDNCGSVTDASFSLTVAVPSHTVTQFYPVASTTGRVITITGTGFVAGSTEVFFGEARQIPATVNVVTPTSISVVVPASSSGAGNINGYLSVRVNGLDVTTLGLTPNVTDPSNPASVFPEFILWGDVNRDGLFGTNDVALARAFLLFQATPTQRQTLAVDVVPANANGSRGNGQLTSTDFSFLRSVSFGQTTF